MSALIELEGVVKQFPGDTEPVLAGISLEVGRGELVALIGPSGCGKSTVLNILAGLIRVTSGTLRINDRDARVSYVFQRPRLLPWRKVRRNVEFSLEQADVTGAARRRAAEAAIERVNLTGHEDKYPHQLSGGMQQRVALARGLAIEPSVLLLDEPFGALDTQTRALMQELLLAVWEAERKTVLFVTHDIDEAVFMANRVLVMTARPGRIKAVVDVALPRPRHYTVKTTPEFAALKARLTDEIRAESIRAVEMEKQ